MTNLNCIYKNVSVLTDGGAFDASPKATSYSYSTHIPQHYAINGANYLAAIVNHVRRIIELCPIFGAKVTSASIRSRFDIGQDPDFFGKLVRKRSVFCLKVWIRSGIAQKSGFF